LIIYVGPKPATTRLSSFLPMSHFADLIIYGYRRTYQRVNNCIGAAKLSCACIKGVHKMFGLCQQSVQRWVQKKLRATNLNNA